MSAFANVDIAAVNANGVLAFENSGLLEHMKQSMESSPCARVWISGSSPILSAFSLLFWKNWLFPRRLPPLLMP
eukprot:gene11907-13453_t